MYSRVPPPHPGLHNDKKEVDVDESNSDAAIDDKPRGISREMWEKFQSLQKKRQAVTKKSTDRRKRELQSKVLNRVREELTSEEDMKILKDNDVHLDIPVQSLKSSLKRKSDAVNVADASSSDCQLRNCIAGGQQSLLNESNTEKEEGSTSQGWMEVKQYIGAQDHIRAPHKEQHAPKGDLEKQIDEAVARGDVDTAEKLSDHLANRQFGKRIADAFDAKAYTENKLKEEESSKAKKKKKLHWGFDHKQRWETKGNM